MPNIIVIICVVINIISLNRVQASYSVLAATKTVSPGYKTVLEEGLTQFPLCASIIRTPLKLLLFV